MSSQANHQPVVVASDGTPSALGGVRYAALEAKRLGAWLEIIHVTPGYLPEGPFLMIPDGALQESARRALEVSADAARNAAEDVHVVSRLVSGSRVHSIVEAGANALLLVLGARAHTLGERVSTGATAPGVCSRAQCPVVVVPEGWKVRDPGAMSKVVVGFKAPEHAAELLAGALELAHSRGAELVVLHAWKLPSAYDDIVTNRVDEEKWRVEQGAVIQSVLDEVRDSHSDVKVRIEVVHDRPARALAKASRDSDRLLIMRPAHGGHLHHLGAVARAVLRDSHCPVEVLPPAASHSKDTPSMSGTEVLDAQRQMSSTE